MKFEKKLSDRVKVQNNLLLRMLMYIQQQENSVFIGANDRKFHFHQIPVLEKNIITKNKNKNIFLDSIVP